MEKLQCSVTPRGSPGAVGGRDGPCLNGSCSSQGRMNRSWTEVASAACYFMFSIRASAFGLLRLAKRTLSICPLPYGWPLSAGKTDMHPKWARRGSVPVHSSGVGSHPSFVALQHLALLHHSCLGLFAQKATDAQLLRAL